MEAVEAVEDTPKGAHVPRDAGMSHGRTRWGTSGHYSYYCAVPPAVFSHLYLTSKKSGMRVRAHGGVHLICYLYF